MFNSRAVIGGKYGWIEQIAPNAFADVLGDDVRMLKNHNPDLILARTTAGNLKLAQTKDGLDVEADMTPTSYARDLALSLDAGDVTQMSFAFEMKSDTWEELDEDDPYYGKTVFNELRTINSFKRLHDVSPVTYPAYVDTDAALRMQELRAVTDVLGLDDDELREIAHEARLGALDLHALIARVSNHGSERSDDSVSLDSRASDETAGLARGNRERIAQVLRKAKVK